MKRKEVSEKLLANDDPISIAKEYGEEEPIYECKNCFRETKYGRDTMKFGVIGFGIRKGICTYCGEKLSTWETTCIEK